MSGQKPLRPRQRYLLRAAWEGRVTSDGSRYFLDGVLVTQEFRPLVAKGLTKPRQPGRLMRIVWFRDDVQREFGGAV